jgi:hypothetical protein
MKRIVPSFLLVLCLLLLPTKERSFAGEQPPIKLASLEWHLLKPGVTKTDMGGDLPEVAILTVSNEEFEKIHASKIAAKRYLDSQKILKRKLIHVVFCDVRPRDDGGYWILTVTHTVYSTACIVALQLPKETKIED